MKFQKLAQAYEILSDSSSRDAYRSFLLEQGCNDGLMPCAIADAGSDPIHVLAEHPDDMIQVLLASPSEGWQKLLKGFRSQQLGQLLESLHALPKDGKKRRGTKIKPHRGHKEHCRDHNHPRLRMKNLHSMERSGVYIYRSEMDMRGLCISTPHSSNPPVVAFYHSVIVELRSCILQCLDTKPTSFETAVLDAIDKLGVNGFACPFYFISRRLVGSKVYLTPTVSELAMALEMRRDLQQLSTAAQIKQAKKKWEKVLQGSLAEGLVRLQEKAKELKGYIFALQEVCSGESVLRLRRCSKQPADVVLKVPFLGRLAASLGQTFTDLEKQLACPEGQNALMDFFCKGSGPRLALLHTPVDLLGQIPEGERATIFGFAGIAQLVLLGAACKRIHTKVQDHLSDRCHKDLILTPRDFTTDDIWQLPQILSFLHEKFAKHAQKIDFTEMPLSVMSSSLLWATLCTLECLTLVVIHHSHALCPPPRHPRRFSVQVGCLTE